MSRGFKARLALNLLLLTASSLLALGGAEALIRIAGHRILGPGEWLSSSPIFLLDDEPVGFSLRPGSSRVLIAGGAYTVRDRMNSLGLRDLERPYERNPGRKRILLLGDSFMFGQGARFEDILPRRLERMLPGVEVINAGIPGYNLNQIYLYYKDRGRRFQPDLVLTGVFINDIEDQRSLILTRDEDGLPLAYRRRPDLVEKDRRKAPQGFRSVTSDWLRRHSMLFALVRQRLRETRSGGVDFAGDDTRPSRPSRRPTYLPFFLAEPDPPTVQAWNEGMRVLDTLKKAVVADGGRFALLLVPADWQLSDALFAQWVGNQGEDPAAYDRLGPQKVLQGWCRNSETPYLDLIDTLAGGGPNIHFPNDVHWTEEGHRVAAEAVRDFLATNGLP